MVGLSLEEVMDVIPDDGREDMGVKGDWFEERRTPEFSVAQRMVEASAERATEPLWEVVSAPGWGVQDLPELVEVASWAVPGVLPMRTMDWGVRPA